MKIGRKDSARGCAMKARSTAAIARSAGYFTASLIRLCIAWATVQASQPLRASLFASEAPDDKHLLEAAEEAQVEPGLQRARAELLLEAVRRPVEGRGRAEEARAAVAADRKSGGWGKSG